MNDSLNKYANDKNIKWIIAQRIGGKQWKVLFLSLSETCPSLEDDSKPYFDAIPQGDFERSEFAVFRNRVDWWEKKPYRLVDYRDHSNDPIPASLGMWVINQADAGYF